MTKKETEKVIDLERRIVLLETELIKRLIAGDGNQNHNPYGSFPQYRPNQTGYAQAVNYMDCQSCGQRYPDTQLHVCPNQTYTMTASNQPLHFSGGLNNIASMKTAGSAIPNQVTPGAVPMKQKKCSCGYYYLIGEVGHSVECPNCKMKMIMT